MFNVFSLLRSSMAGHLHRTRMPSAPRPPPLRCFPPAAAVAVGAELLRGVGNSSWRAGGLVSEPEPEPAAPPLIPPSAHPRWRHQAASTFPLLWGGRLVLCLLGDRPPPPPQLLCPCASRCSPRWCSSASSRSPPAATSSRSRTLTTR